MFDEIINLLLVKKSEYQAIVEKIDTLLAECGYEEPTETPETNVDEQAVTETTEAENGETIY